MDKKAIVLSVAGSDSSGGAGIQADIKAISALGGYAATAITAITVQNTLGVQAVHPVAAELVGQQMQAVMEDLQPDAIKIGMTGNVEIIYEIVRILRRYSPRKVVFDPVMVSTSGHSLMTDDIITGKASIKGREDVENVVCSLNRIKAIRGKYSAEELSGEPPQAMITCYDEGDNEIYTVKFYDGFMMVDNELYRITGKVYKELAELCDKYGKC